MGAVASEALRGGWLEDGRRREALDLVGRMRRDDDARVDMVRLGLKEWEADRTVGARKDIVKGMMMTVEKALVRDSRRRPSDGFLLTTTISPYASLHTRQRHGA
jgi:hypothetical protein